MPQIKEEVELLLALKQAGVSVAYPILDVYGKGIQVLEAVEGKRCAVLVSYAPGRAMKALSEKQPLRTMQFF